MTAYFLVCLVLAPLPWIGLYRLDRRCALVRETGDLDTKGKGTEPATIPSLASADRRSRDAGPLDTGAGTVRPGGPMQNAPPRLPCRDAARRDAH